jgi:hypothetical protein
MASYKLTASMAAIAAYPTQSTNNPEVGRLKIGQTATGSILSNGWLWATLPTGAAGWMQTSKGIFETVITDPTPPPDPTPTPTPTAEFSVTVHEDGAKRIVDVKGDPNLVSVNFNTTPIS